MECCILRASLLFLCGLFVCPGWRLVGAQRFRNRGTSGPSYVSSSSSRSSYSPIHEPPLTTMSSSYSPFTSSSGMGTYIHEGSSVTPFEPTFISHPSPTLGGSHFGTSGASSFPGTGTVISHFPSSTSYGTGYFTGPMADDTSTSYVPMSGDHHSRQGRSSYLSETSPSYHSGGSFFSSDGTFMSSDTIHSASSYVPHSGSSFSFGHTLPMASSHGHSPVFNGGTTTGFIDDTLAGSEMFHGSVTSSGDVSHVRHYSSTTPASSPSVLTARTRGGTTMSSSAARSRHRSGSSPSPSTSTHLPAPSTTTTGERPSVFSSEGAHSRSRTDSQERRGGTAPPLPSSTTTTTTPATSASGGNDGVPPEGDREMPGDVIVVERDGEFIYYFVEEDGRRTQLENAPPLEEMQPDSFFTEQYLLDKPIKLLNHVRHSETLEALENQLDSSLACALLRLIRASVSFRGPQGSFRCAAFATYHSRSLSCESQARTV